MDKRMEELAGALRALRSAVYAADLDRDIISVTMDFAQSQRDKIEVLLCKPDLLGPDARRLPFMGEDPYVRLECDLGGVTLITYERQGEE